MRQQCFLFEHLVQVKMHDIFCLRREILDVAQKLKKLCCHTTKILDKCLKANLTPLSYSSHLSYECIMIALTELFSIPGYWQININAQCTYQRLKKNIGRHFYFLLFQEKLQQPGWSHDLSLQAPLTGHISPSTCLEDTRHWVSVSLVKKSLFVTSSSMSRMTLLFKRV